MCKYTLNYIRADVGEGVCGCSHMCEFIKSGIQTINNSTHYQNKGISHHSLMRPDCVTDKYV